MNPFIELWRDPVTTLTVLGYCLGLLALVSATLSACWSNVLVIVHRWRQERPRKWKWDAPPSWWLRVAAVPAILAVDAWAIAALVYILG